MILIFLISLLLTNRQFSNLRKALANHLSAEVVKNSIIKNGTITRIFRQIIWSITNKNWITINKKCN